MNKFFISKMVAPGDLPALVIALNTRTRDGYIAHQERIDSGLWLIRIACLWRDDAEFVRSL